MSAMEPEIVPKGTLSPGACIFTGEWDNLIDTKRDLDHLAPHGYIAVSYVEELARDLLGMVPKEDVQHAIEAAEHLADQNAELKAELEAYKGVRKALEKVG